MAGRTLKPVFTGTRAKMTDRATVLARNGQTGRAACTVPSIQKSGGCQIGVAAQV